MAKLYEFSLTLCGWGNNPMEAWDNCKDSFDIDKENVPEEFEITDEEE